VANDESFDIHEEFDDVDKSLKDAREGFLSASESFGTQGEQFSRIVTAQLERLRDPARADAIQDGATEAIGAINHFVNIHADLAGQVASLSSAFSLKVLTAQSRMLAAGAAAFALPTGSNLAEAIRETLKNCNTQQRELIAIATSTILLGHRAAEAMRSAAAR
jgi:hypothetical protein